MLLVLISFSVIIVIVFFAIRLYNRLIRGRNDVKNAWGAIDVQLKRRHDLIPNLIEVVKAYASHERQTLDAVIQARQEAIKSSGRIEARAKSENALSTLLRSLLALAEAYPNLKANESFIALQTELVATENKIGFARQYYNDNVLRYNNCVQTFPGNIVAGMYSFRLEPFFQLEKAGEREAPQFKL
ncbi:MAG: LemA family protein [Deltaproteobacteria bacterium]